MFVVLAFAATGDALLPAAAGAIAAGILVSLAGVLLYRPLTRVHENTLKFGGNAECVWDVLCSAKVTVCRGPAPIWRYSA